LRIGVTIHRAGTWYVAIDLVSGVASQGKSCDEALKNFQEAFELWFENAEGWEKERAIEGYVLELETKNLAEKLDEMQERLCGRIDPATVAKFVREDREKR